MPNKGEHDSYQGTPSGVPNKREKRPALAAVLQPFESTTKTGIRNPTFPFIYRDAISHTRPATAAEIRIRARLQACRTNAKTRDRL